MAIMKMAAMTVMKMAVTTDMSQSRFDSLKNYYKCNKNTELNSKPHY